MRMPRTRLRSVCPWILALVLAACGPAAETTSVWGDVVRGVVAGNATVEVLTPLGVDTHDYRPSPSQVAALQTADLVVANGLGLEEGLVDVLEALEADGANIFDVAPLLEPIPFGRHDHSDSEGQEPCDPGESHEEDGEDQGTEEEHAHGSCDPHVWMDPRRVEAATALIAQELQKIAPGIDWMSAAAEYARTLAQTDTTIIETIASISLERRKLVTSHEAFGYFADRYDFEIIGVVIPGGSTLAEPSSAQLASLVATMENEGVTVIFAETTQPTALAEAVAAELGDDVQVVELYTESLGEPGSDAETLPAMLNTNAERIAGALG